MPGLVDQHGRPLTAERTSRQDAIRAAFRRNFRRLEARFDAAQTTDDNRRHWANADNLSAAAAANPEVRRKLRNRARYECQQNNSFGKGLILTIANDVIGRGPRLQLNTDDPRLNKHVSRLFNRWARKVQLAKRLRTMRASKAIDGEIFCLPKTNRRLKHPVKLDLRLVEGDQVTTPTLDLSPDAVDGIRFDGDSNPAEYDLLKEHPGTDRPIFGGLFETETIDADSVIHWFREDRPEQRRGIPEVTPALPLFAQVRRWVLATIAAAETAAEYAGVVYTDSPALEKPEDVEVMDAIELEMRALLTLPAGWKMGQVKAEHPNAQFTEFREAMYGEAARCMLVPIGKALGDHRGYTFASGKLDRDGWLDAVVVDRHDCECVVLDPVFSWWLAEASLVPGLLPPDLQFAGGLPEHSWQWDGFRITDPAKQAVADSVYWELGLMTDEDFLQRNGIQPEEHDRRLERQMRRRRRFGLPLPGDKDRDPVAAATQHAEDDDDEAGRTQTAGNANTGDRIRGFASHLAANGPPSELQAVCTGAVTLTAAEGDGSSPPRFSMEAYSGGLMRPIGFSRDVVLDLAGLDIPDQSLPVHRDHDFKRIVGHTQQIDNDRRQLTAAGLVSGTGPDAEEIRGTSGNGFPWKSSVGAKINEIRFIEENEQVQANGRVFDGPIWYVPKATLKEISFVSIAGDPTTSATVAAAHSPGRNRTMDEFLQYLQARGFDSADLSDQQRAALQADFQAAMERAVFLAAGSNLASTLNRLIDAATDNDNTRADVIARMASTAGITGGTVSEILQANIDCPPLNRLQGFARALGIDVAQLRSAAESDGCSYGASAGGEGGTGTGTGTGGQTGDLNAGGDNDPIVISRQRASTEIRRQARIQEIAASHPAIAAQAIEEGWDEHRTELNVLRASRPSLPAGGGAGSMNGRNGYSAQAFETALCISIGMAPEIAGSSVETLQATFHLEPDARLQARQQALSQQEMNRAMSREYRGLTLHALMDTVILQAGGHYHGSRKTDAFYHAAVRADRELRAGMDLQAATGFSTISLSGILGNVANKALIASYEAQETTWQFFCAVRSHSDFKVWSRYRLDSTGAFKKVGPDGELKHVGLAEGSFTNQLDTHGAIIALTRQMRINDDLDAFTQIPVLVGRMSAVKVEEEVYVLLLSNPSAFFSAGNGNLLTGAGSALSITSLSDAKELFRNQVDSNGKPILTNPRLLLVPTTLEVEADDLVTQTQMQVGLDTTDAPRVLRNPHAGTLSERTSPYLNNTSITNSEGKAITGQSNTAWYVLADPNVRAAIAVATLNGQRLPTIESDESDFTTLGMQWRGYHDFGVGMEDPVAAVKSNGA